MGKLRCFLSFLSRSVQVLMLAGAGLIIIFVLLLGWMIYMDKGTTVRYKTYQEWVVADQGRGWIPSFFPEDAYDIKEYHECSSPECQAINFKFSGTASLRRKIQAGALDKISADRIQDRDMHKAYASSTPDTDFYCTPDFYRSGCLMVDWQKKTALFKSHCIKDK